MKFALSSSIVGEDMASLAERCRSAGCDGVELEYRPELVADVSRAFNDSGLSIACIASTACFTGEAATDADAGLQIRACLDLAQQVRCHLVKISDPRPRKRESLMDTINSMAEWLMPLANAAADRGMVIAVENNQTLATARPLWQLMERLDHSAVGICWKVENTLAAGENVAVTIPTLNSRIRYVRMDHENPEAMTRLRGIGYQGWVRLGDRG